MHMQTMYCYKLDEKILKNNVFCGLNGINHGVCSTAEETVTPWFGYINQNVFVNA